MPKTRRRKMKERRDKCLILYSIASEDLLSVAGRGSGAEEGLSPYILVFFSYGI